MSAEERLLPLLLEFLPDEIQRKEEQSLNETRENRTKCLSVLKANIQAEDALRNRVFHDDFLIQFVRHSKHDSSRALKRLKSYCAFKDNHPEYFQHVDQDKLAASEPAWTFSTPLPYRCQDGCAIVLMEYSKWHPRMISHPELARLMVMLLQQCLRVTATQMCGFKVIVDYSDAPFAQILYNTPYNMYNVAKIGLDCLPVRYKACHFVNISPVGRAGLALLWPFLPTKLKKRVHVHRHSRDLLNFFPSRILPEKYGGQLKDYYMKDWIINANNEHKMKSVEESCNIA